MCFTLILAVLISFIGTSQAQCVIASQNAACVDDPINFSIQSTSSIKSVSWSFGDGNTSTLKTPFHRFSQAGTFKVRATVTDSSGNTCDTSKTITVYNPPELKIFLSKSNQYCLTQNKVCLIDSSTSGNSGVVNEDRNILWGDGGKTYTQYPTTGAQVCYTYSREGKYTITVEHINQKGCKAKQEVKIEILKDFIPSYTSSKKSQGCDSQTHVFKLDTSWAQFSGDIVKLEYDFGDGNKMTTNVGDSLIYTYKKSGNLNAILYATFTNGCIASFKKLHEIVLDKIDIKHQKLDTTVCFPGSFEFNHPIVPGLSVRYSWSVYDSAKNLLGGFGGSRNSFFFPDTPGKYYIGLEIQRNDCHSYMMYDSVESIGVKSRALILNGSQCIPEDTVFFCNQSVIYGTNDVYYLWKFIDTAAPACTTNTAKGLYVNSNCNFSEDEHTKHLYKNQKCDEIWLTAVDKENGCRDSAKFNVIIGKPDLNTFKYTVGKACIGSQSGYGVDFELESCFGDIEMNLDSACGRDSFEDFRNRTTYIKTCDTSGWVTLGLRAVTGDAKVYRSCDTSDYVIDSSKICVDSLWINRAYQIQVAPKPQFKYSFKGCIPSIMSGSLFIRQQPNVRWMFFDWDDGSYDTTYIPPGSDSLPDFSHAFRRSGVYYPRIILETDSGCQDDQRIMRIVGFYNNYHHDSLICPGMTVFFKDTVTYWEDTMQYWRKATRPEKIFWDWDGAKGPASGFEVSATFDTPGVYHVKMMSVDIKGCRDTMEKRVVVEDVRAGIKDVTKKIVCDDILQLIDSSYALNHWKDSIIYHYWDFGDGKTPSYLRNPFHYYDGHGNYDVMHIVENSIGCKDTAYTSITIEGPIPHFDIISDSVGCAPFTAEFKNNSVKASDFIWYFGDASSASNTLSTKSDSNVTFTYNNPGIYYVYLYAGDSVVNPDNNNKIYYCNAVFPDSNLLVREVRRIIVLPKPRVDFTYEGDVCLNSTLKLKDSSDSMYTYYRWFWGSDSSTGPNKEQDIVIRDTSKLVLIYKPIYTPTGPYQRACFDTIRKEIKVLGNNVTFSFVKDELCPTYRFTSDAKPGTKLIWDFGHPSSGDSNRSEDASPTHTFAPDNGDFKVCLTSISKEGCYDSACKTVVSQHAFSMLVPNVFTPNNDGLNDLYEIEIEGEDFYELSIYNRWGTLVYRSNQDYEPDSEFNWDGSEQQSGRPCPPGTYFYVLRFREACLPGAKKEVTQGTITLIR